MSDARKDAERDMQEHLNNLYFNRADKSKLMPCPFCGSPMKTRRDLEVTKLYCITIIQEAIKQRASLNLVKHSKRKLKQKLGGISSQE